MHSDQSHEKVGHAIRDIIKKKKSKQTKGKSNAAITSITTITTIKKHQESRSIKKQQQQQQTQNSCVSNHVDCEFTRAFGLTSSNILNSVFDNIQEDENDEEFMTAAPPPTQLVRCVSEEEENDDDFMTAAPPLTKLVRCISEDSSSPVPSTCVEEEDETIFSSFNYYNRHSFRACADFEKGENRHDLLTNEESMENSNFNLIRFFAYRF